MSPHLALVAAAGDIGLARLALRCLDEGVRVVLVYGGTGLWRVRAWLERRATS